MSIDPRSRRVRALTNRHADRVLVKPAKYAADLEMPEKGSCSAYVISSLRRGVTSLQLEAETGWSRSSVRVNLHKIARKAGVGIVRRDDMFFLRMPDDSEELAHHVRVINPEDETDTSDGPRHMRVINADDTPALDVAEVEGDIVDVEDVVFMDADESVAQDEADSAHDADENEQPEEETVAIETAFDDAADQKDGDIVVENCSAEETAEAPEQTDTADIPTEDFMLADCDTPEFNVAPEAVANSEDSARSFYIKVPEALSAFEADEDDCDEIDFDGVPVGGAIRVVAEVVVAA